MNGPALLKQLRAHQDEMVAMLRAVVEHESPSREKFALDALADVIEARFAASGGQVERVPNMIGGDHVLARFGAETEAQPALVLGHFDTVWPLGTLAKQPFRIEGALAHGPGVFDMKASIVLFEFAWKAITALGLRPPRQVVALFSSDEEVGSPTARRLIESEAEKCAYVLVLEAPLPGGALKTARKGVGRFSINVEGKAAHAGIEPENGVSAIHEIVQQILRIDALADVNAGTTINVGIVEGGTMLNVVPATATARLEVRVRTNEEARRMERELRALRPVTPGASLHVTGGFHRPPMERTLAIAALFERARTIGAGLGMELTEGATGGASDGNFTAALGVPTLDGLGVLGAGAHSLTEHMVLASLPERAALLAALLLEL